MAAPSKTAVGCIAVGLATLALCEYAVITELVLPLPSTPFDWKVATGFIAPMTAAFLLWLAATIARIIADTLALIKRTEQWITKSLNNPPADQPPSSSTPSAAPPSSSCGWPSDGSSSTWHRGNEGIPWP